MLFAWLIPNGRAQTVEVGSASQSGSFSFVDEEEAGAGFVSRLPINFSVGLSGGYDDNVNITTSGGGSSFTTVVGSLSYDLPGQRTYLTLRAGGEFTDYLDLETGKSTSTNTYLDLSLVHNVSERFQLSSSVDATYRTEPNFKSGVGVQNVRSNFLDATGTASASYNLTQRTTLTSSFSFHRVKYDKFSIGFFQDRAESTFGESISYGLLPVTTTVLLDYHFQMIDYDTIRLDSNNHIFLLGIDEGLTPQLKVTVRGGATLRSYVDGRDSTDPNIEVTLTYTGAHNSRVSWITSYSLEEANTTAAQSRKTIRTGLNASYDLLDRITATAAVYYHHDENQSFAATSFLSDTLDVSLGLRYSIQGGLSLNLDFEYSEMSSDLASQSYTRNRISAGLTYTY